MGQIAWMSVFMFVVFPIDINDNENEAIMKALDKNWDFINEQIDKTFSGIKTEVKELNKNKTMCKIPNVNVGIKWLDFNMRGKFSVMLTDGRQIIVPASMFPDIKHMSQKHRNEWMILDHQYFTFEHMTRVYSILDIMNINQPAA